MTIKQDQLEPQTTSVTFEDLHNDITATRYLHNGSDFLKCEFTEDPANPILRYYQTDGDKAAAFAMAQPNQLDLTYEPNSGKYYSARAFDSSIDLSSTELVDLTATTGVYRNFDNFESGIGANILFTGGDPVDGIEVQRGPDTIAGFSNKLRFKRPLGNPTPDVSLPNYAGGLYQAGDTLLSGTFNVTMNYDMFLAQSVGVGDALLSIRHFDQENGNERWAMGVTSSGDGSSQVMQYTLALDNTEDVTSSSFVVLANIKVKHKEVADYIKANGTGALTFTLTASTSGSPHWDITTPNGTEQDLLAESGTSPMFDIDFVEIDLDAPDAAFTAWDDGISGEPGKLYIGGQSGESLTFTIQNGRLWSPTPTGTFDFTRTLSGPLLENALYQDNVVGYSFNYGGLDFFANEKLTQEIYFYTDQFELIAGLADNFLISPSGAATPDDAISNAVTKTITVTKITNRGMAIDQVDDEGNVLNSLISNLNVLNPLVEQEVFQYLPPLGTYSPVSSGVISGSELGDLTSEVGIASDDSNSGYIYYDDQVYAFNLTVGTYTGTVSGTSPGIVTSSVTSGSALDFSFNPNSGGFLQYQTRAAGEDLLRTLDISVSSGVTNSTREVFLNFPDSHVLGPGNSFGIGDHVFLHGSDPNTLFYFRRNGDNLNVKKVDSSGTVAGLILNDSSASFTIVSNVQKGDDVYISSLDQHFIVDEVLDDNNLRLETAPSAGSYSYRLYAGAEQLQYNIDTSLSAFASVNVDDFSLRAGTSDNTIVTAEVINAWGDPLSGKSVSFIVSNGDGAVSPSSDSTDGNGEANTTYTAGVTPGPVEITATVSD